MAAQSPPKAPLGLIMSSVDICRAPGDVGNIHTFDFPILQAEATNSPLMNIVSSHGYDEDFLDSFVQAGNKLVAQGVVGIITSCGFLVHAQEELAQRLPIPVAASSLMQIPSIRTFLSPSQGIGILTFDSQRLNESHLGAIGIQDCSNIYIGGPPSEGHMKKHIRDGEPYVFDVLEYELVESAKKLVTEHPNIGAIVLECTQFPPFAFAIQREIRLPVYDIFTMARWFYSGLARVPFPDWTEEEMLEAAQRRHRASIDVLESDI